MNGGTVMAPQPREARGGFALMVVVFMLFAIGVAGATGYQVVRSEFELSRQNQESLHALAVARAGLDRFVAEQIGVVGDSVSYAIGNGIVTITTRKLAELDSLNHLYLLRAESSVTDTRYPDSPARRVVGMYAYHRIAPVKHKAAILITEGRLTLRSNADVDGRDQADTGDCPGGGTAGVAGVGTGGRVRVRSGGKLRGNPDKDESYSGFSEVYDSTGIRWDVLSDPDFPVEFDGSPPNFATLPPDSFPVVRKVGNLNAGWSWSGRGVLIVTGRLRMRWGFRWDGIILAGELDRTSSWYDPYPIVDGTLIVGLNSQPNETLRSGNISYHSCNVYAANNSLSYLEPLPSTMWEEAG